MSRDSRTMPQSAENVAKTIVTRTEAETADVGARIADRLAPGDTIALDGSLGSGKTVLARGIIRQLCGAETTVPSPTFTLIQTYDTARFEIWHCDLYRLENTDDALELGLDEAFANAVTLVEWPEKLGRLLPPNHLQITFADLADEEARQITFSGNADWRRVLIGLEADAGS